jgi:hypothetical protein
MERFQKASTVYSMVQEQVARSSEEEEGRRE